ncbi:MAG: DUF615 domain-containing protein [Betaproteobacteria bacterium]|nr:DUF615 domain-containing protein [Betaproteobacteria bacterium]
MAFALADIDGHAKTLVAGLLNGFQSTHQDLGEALVTLRDNEFARVKLPERLRDAVVACRLIKAHEAKRRQLQYVGRVMRELDETEFRSVLLQLQKFRPVTVSKANEATPSTSSQTSMFPQAGEKTL